MATQYDMEFEGRAEEFDPCLQWLRVADSGELWVLSGQGIYDQPDGALQTYDVFTADGIFDRQMVIACPGDPLHDRLVFSWPARALLLRGGLDADPVYGVPTSGNSDATVGVVCYVLPG